MRYLIWDFDGTLAYRRGLWSGAMLDVLREAAPDLRVSREDLRSHLAMGFPWHSPERAHPELDTPEKWWRALDPVFERAFLVVGVEPEAARGLAARVREAYVDPDKWQVYDDVLPALDGLSSLGWTHVVLSNHVPELSQIAGRLDLGERIRRILTPPRRVTRSPTRRRTGACSGTWETPRPCGW